MDDDVNKKITSFFALYRVRHYSKGQILILHGDTPEYVYHLVSGRVKQYDVSTKGYEIIVNIFQPPAFFPMSIAINQTPNDYTFEAETDIDLRQVPVKDAIRFIKENPDVMYDLLSRVYRGLDGILAKTAHLMASSARERLLYEILIACRRYGELHPDGSCTLTLSESDLGARAGLSRETVSREMRKLEKEGLIQMKSGYILIFSFDKLKIANT